MTSRRSVIVREIVAPVIVLIALLGAVEGLLRSAPVVEYIDRHRPQYGSITMRLHVEKQLWHLEALTRSVEPRVVFAGSSSVANGIDESIVTGELRRAGLAYSGRNFGMAGVLGYELPGLSRYYLADGTAAVVYLYNGFSFGDELHPDAIDTRWDTAEMVRLVPINPLDTTKVAEVVDRTFAQRVWLLRYRNLLLSTARRKLADELQPLQNLYDYDANREVARDRPRTLAAPIDDRDWVRRAHLQSGERESSLGLRGLRRFCELAASRHIPLIVTAAPEAVFGRYEGYARDVDYAAIDRRVRALAESCGAKYLPRHDALEERDEWFVDSVHLGAEGRGHFSALIAREAAALLR